MTTAAVWTPGVQQAEALEDIANWYRNSPEQVYRLFGYAGVGKTTCSCHAVAQLGLTEVCAGAYTGKAAHVMRTRGGWPQAGTIHSLIYKPLGDSNPELDRLHAEMEATLLNADLDEAQRAERVAELKAAIKAEERKPRQMRFTLAEESELACAQLLVLDEASMVGENMAADLLSYGRKILVLGDPAQLPPVGRDEGFFTNAAPNYLLTEVHRAALDSPITRLATMIRGCDARDQMLGVSGREGSCGRYDRLPTGIQRYDQVICGTNRTRWRLINKIRDALGFYGTAPVPNDRIIVLANSKDAGVFNGQQFCVLACEADPEDKRAEKWMLTVRDDEGIERGLRVWREGFEGPEGEKSVKFSGRGLTAAATFAQAITCHKSQGSEWSNVLVVDESNVFRTIKLKSAQGQAQVARAHAEARSWLYTAVTRASNHVSIMDVDDLLPRRR